MVHVYPMSVQILFKGKGTGYKICLWPNTERTTYNIYWNTLKTQHLIQCQCLPVDQIIPVIDNEMDKSDQIACIRYKNQNDLA